MKRQIGGSRALGRRAWRGRAILAGTLLASLAATPGAQASRPHSVHGVVVHLRGADRALTRLVASPSGPLAGMYLRRAEDQGALAGKIARSMAATAHGGTSAERAATGLGLLADHQTGVAQSLTSLVGDTRPELQAAVAQAISGATGQRRVVLARLSGLLPDLATGSRPVVAQIVAMESSQGAQVPVALAEVLGANSVACAATGAVQQALVVTTQAFQLGLSDLGPALALVSAAVHAQVQSEIDGIPGLLSHIEEQLAGAVPCSNSTQPTGPTKASPVAALEAPVLLAGMTQLIDGIIDGLLPGLAAGQTPTPVAAPAPLAGLLGGATGFLGGLWRSAPR
ncbi:MAG: hypothetical protein LC720_00025 [Actinobacteria bacterium]|nr:hypothetical protein [Actinomycetota bacterium]